MQQLGEGFDGTLEKAIESSKLLSGKWKPVQEFILAGDFKTGLAKKVDATNFRKDDKDSNLQNYAAQLASLDKSSQRIVLRTADIKDEIQSVVQSLLDATAAGKKMNSVLFEQTASEWKVAFPYTA